MSILIVDDSKPFRVLVETILRRHGYSDLILVESAREGVRILHNSVTDSKHPKIDLVLMDNLMPGVNGIEAARAIKTDNRLKDIPIIIVTAENDEKTLERAFDAGAIDYISKPINKVELRARVRSVLKLKEEMDRRKAREKQLRAMARRLELLSRQDGLTGVANRRSFDEAFEKEWMLHKRRKSPLAVVMIDLDFFKAYNDSYGHLQGDVCLKMVASAIEDSLKRPGDFMARYGGEEFVAFLSDTGADGAFALGEEIRAVVADLAIEHRESLVSSMITVSIGVASIVPADHTSPNELLSAADQALYKAKSGGRNRVEQSAKNQ